MMEGCKIYFSRKGLHPSIICSASIYTQIFMKVVHRYFYFLENDFV